MENINKTVKRFFDGQYWKIGLGNHNSGFAMATLAVYSAVAGDGRPRRQVLDRGKLCWTTAGVRTIITTIVSVLDAGRGTPCRHSKATCSDREVALLLQISYEYDR